MMYDNILQTVGHTPLVRLHRLCDGLKPKIYAKLNYINPGGSVKDRIAIRMVDEAERTGLLQPGGTIIEGTAGNTGMGLALVAAASLVSGHRDLPAPAEIDLASGLDGRRSLRDWRDPGRRYGQGWHRLGRRAGQASKEAGPRLRSDEASLVPMAR